MSSHPPKRRLLKFSLYSTAVVLPKKILAELGWEPGDEVSIISDLKDKQLLVRRSPQVKSETPIVSNVQAQHDIPTPAQPEKIVSGKDNDEVLPIPEID